MTDDHDSNEPTGIDRRTALRGGAAGLGILGLTALGSGSAAASNGADKFAVAGSTMEVMEVTSTNTENRSSTHTLLSGSIKTSSPTDLIIQPTLETALFTDIVTEGNDSSSATAAITGWVEIDGEPIVVATDYDQMTRQEASEVVFDRREHKMTVANLDDDDATMREFLRTRSTNGFNWIDLNMGSGDHTVELKGRLDVSSSDETASAKAIVGPRTLVVEPVKLSNDATI